VWQAIAAEPVVLTVIVHPLGDSKTYGTVKVRVVVVPSMKAPNIAVIACLINTPSGSYQPILPTLKQSRYPQPLEI
jgi:hypothetical protein